MKKLIKILSASVVSVAFMGNVASAQTMDSCTSIVITNTGANSNNSGTCTVNVNVIATCINNVWALNSNQQAAATGAANSVGNTTTGAAITGEATNSNGNNVTLGASCDTLATPAGETPTPGQGGGGGGAADTPEVLPNTANESAPVIIAASLAAAAGVIAISRLIVVAYRHITLR